MTEIVVKCPSCKQQIPYDVEYLKLRAELTGGQAAGFCHHCLAEHVIDADGKVRLTGRKINPFAATT
ncbi:MAG: hypothetical protein ACE5PO_08400 [Candidatus Bathyarchaeia archaeon]